MLKRFYTKLTNFNKRGGERGFTLVELMLVIAVIAILVLVLLPKTGVVKNKARESGLKVNMALMEAEVNSVIDNFTTSASDINALEKRINTDINNALVSTNTSQKIRNPITGITGCVEKAAIASGGAVVYIDTTDDTADAAGLTLTANWPTAATATYKGIIGFGAYSNTATGRVEVRLIPYDASGNQITEMITTISQ